jgi:hypothetical protein
MQKAEAKLLLVNDTKDRKYAISKWEKLIRQKA